MIISHTCFITSTFQDVVDWCDDVDAINLLSIKLQHWHIPLWWTSGFIHLTVEPCCHTRATLCHTEFTISWRKGYLDLFEFPAICLAFHSLSLRALPSLSQPSDLLGKGNPPKSCQGFNARLCLRVVFFACSPQNTQSQSGGRKQAATQRQSTQRTLKQNKPVQVDKTHALALTQALPQARHITIRVPVKRKPFNCTVCSSSQTSVALHWFL